MFRNTFHKKLVSLRRLNTACKVTILMIVIGLQGCFFRATVNQEAFESPEKAVAALAQAVEESNTNELVSLIGPKSETLISSGDEVQDRQRQEKFIKAYDQKNRLEMCDDGIVKLFIGDDDWPFPFPIVKTGENWHFDAKSGKEEILNRWIGENELSAIQVCLAISDAQRDYADLMNEMHGQPEYAQKFKSSKGQKDGLYWEASPDCKPSPLGPLVANARAKGYDNTVGESVPYHGYLYKILKVQGESANGGAYSYVINGKMIGGFGIVAFPAVYGSSGVHTFIVNYEGIVYLKDLGENTTNIAATMTTFNPDATWNKVE
jgi:hypothetical protein